MAESFTSHLPTILAGTTATVIATLGTSFLGYAGTIAGVAVGSLLTGGGAYWWERIYRKTGHRAKLIAEATKAKGAPLSGTETQHIHKIVDSADKVNHRNVPWKYVCLMAGSVFLGSLAVLAFIELGTGKPVSAIVQNQPAHGIVVPVATSQPQNTTAPTPTSPVTQPTTFPPTPIPTTPTATPADTTPPTATAPAATAASSTQTSVPGTPSSIDTGPVPAGSSGP